eukprot:PITA_21676
MAESTSAMAASTSAAANPNNIQCYDVFINHRGTDVKETFAKDLYKRLDSEGLSVFLDRPELEAEETFSSQIENAITTASVQVAIFSPGYAESEGCLNKLLSMLDTLQRGAKVIPVFYEVEPSDLRKAQSNGGIYGKAFCERNPPGDAGTIKKWKDALCRSADISGLELKTSHYGESELLDKVVECTLKNVQLKRLDVADYPTGLDDKVKDFVSKIFCQQQHNAKGKVVGIVGLGGVGKTTLVKEFFNGKRSQYRRNCFLHDIRTSSLISLQKKLLQSLIGSDLKIDNIDAGKTELRKHLSTDKALVVLDDVDDISQVNALLPVRTVFHSDSLILITSRYRDVLTSSVVEDSLIYPLTGLNTKHSKELFCRHSFNQDHPCQGFETLVDEFLKVCDGLPLSLVVIGALLRGKDNRYWRKQLDKLHIVPNTIKQKLKISYDALEEEEREMFLDIACFFVRYNRDTVMRIWDGTGWKCWLGFHKLQNRHLVRVDSENGIQMHDHLQDMGRDIAKDMEGRLPRRLWRWTDDVIDDLLQRTSNEQSIMVRGIRMDLSDYKKLNDAFDDIALMRLQLLDTEKGILEHIINWVKSPNLKWLRWNECPYPALPSWSLKKIKNLRVLHVSGSTLKTLWEEESQAPSELRELEIYGPLRNIPESIRRLEHLERIVVGRFSNIGRVNLIELPEEFCELKSLKALVLKECSRLKSLPHSFGKLTTLEHIDLSLCRNLETLPDSFGSLRNLEHIDLSNCYDLRSLPDSFRCLGNLQRIFLQGCHQLKRLPDYFGNLKKLQHINLSDCHGLTELPESFGDLSKLEYIDFSRCHNLKSLPHSFGNLTNLQRINLSNCHDLETLPDCFDNLKNLQDIDLSKCHNLERLPNSLRTPDKSNILCLEGCPYLITM